MSSIAEVTDEGNGNGAEVGSTYAKTIWQYGLT